MAIIYVFHIEEIVWQDIEGFLRNPGLVLHKLTAKLRELEGSTEDREGEIKGLEETLAGKENERQAILGLFRKGSIDEAALDQQLVDIEREAEHLEKIIRDLRGELERSKKAGASLLAAEDLLNELNARLDQPLTWEIKRQLVETLVESVRMDTFVTETGKEAKAEVTYRFSKADPTAGETLRTRGRLLPFVLHRRLDHQRSRASPQSPLSAPNGLVRV